MDNDTPAPVSGITSAFGGQPANVSGCVVVHKKVFIVNEVRMMNTLDRCTSLLIYTPGHRDIYLYLGNKTTSEILVKVDPLKFHKATEYIHSILQEKDKWQALYYLEDETRHRVGFKAKESQPLEKKMLEFLEGKEKIDENSLLKGFYFPVFSSVFSRWKESSLAEAAREKEKKEYDFRLALITTDQKDSRYKHTDTCYLGKILALFAMMGQDGFELKEEEFPSIPENPHTYQGIMDYSYESLQPAMDDRLSAWYDGKEWKKSLRLYISMNLGTQAMAFGLYAALRYYEPRVLHAPRAMTPLSHIKWLETECHDNRLVELTRIIPREQIKTPLLKGLIEAMREWVEEFPSWPTGKEMASLSSKEGEEKAEEADLRSTTERTLDRFWYRKSEKPVLAVLALEMPESTVQGEKKYDFIRSCNLEVSLPTGTLCAERSAIGQALSRYPTLRREQIKAVAVFSKATGGSSLNPLLPCGACREWLEKIAEVNPSFEVVTFADDQMQVVHLQKI
jgi:cytidine deaminase